MGGGGGIYYPHVNFERDALTMFFELEHYSSRRRNESSGSGLPRVPGILE